MMPLFRRHPPPPAGAPPALSPAACEPGDAFTPTRPKTGRRRLIGRDRELRRILQALAEDHAHVVLYSERGRGKTSLANMVVEALGRADATVARFTCDAATGFDDLMRGLMRDLPHAFLSARVGPADETGCVGALPAGALQARDIVDLPNRLNCRFLVCVIDEFDRVEDPAIRTRLADTIKQLSDKPAALLFLIVGVSENLDQILGQHPSIQRAVHGVHLPLFTDRDVAQLILRGGRETGLQFPAAIVARITVLARGMPYMAQLLGLRLAQAAKERGEDSVSEADFALAIERLIQDAGPRVLALYAALSDYGRDSEMVLALRRIASAPQDPWGRLEVMETGDGVIVGGRSIPASCWERLKAVRVLHPAVAGRELYVFAERGLMHHALLLAARDAVLPEAETAPDTDAVAAIEARGAELRAAALSRLATLMRG